MYAADVRVRRKRILDNIVVVVAGPHALNTVEVELVLKTWWFKIS
jgi:hypothetical protein